MPAEVTGDPWTQHMRQGDLAAAWAISDAVLESRAGISCAHCPRHLQYIWNGRPLEGQRVLIRCYHGLGDTVQFIRYAPRVRATAREVILWAQPELLPLLITARGIDRWLPLHDGVPACEWDVDVEIMELPHVFRSTLETLPARVPYLYPESGARRDQRTLHVGVAWSSGAWDQRRSIPFPALSPLFATEGVTFHILQRGYALRDCPPGTGIVSPDEGIASTASLMRGLDLVISIDSFPAHLAGALGVRVWTLLHADPDWRWLLEREDCPWYPTMRLFRQQEPGNWQPVIARVVRELAALAANRIMTPDTTVR